MLTKKNIVTYIVVATALFLLFYEENETKNQKEVDSAKKIEDSRDDITIGNFNNLKLLEKEKAVLEIVELNGWDKNASNKYINCIVDLSLKKESSMKVSQIANWCHQEKINNLTLFTSHPIAKENRDIENEAYTICKILVENQFTQKVKFPYMERKIFKKESNRYIVKSTVISNSITKLWSCDIKYIGEDEEYMNMNNWDYKLSFQ